MKALMISCSLLIFLSCARDRITDFEFLEGTWKIEGKEQYEVWVKKEKNGLTGYSYKINDNRKTILESIAIKIVDEQVIYEATVPDQNEGKTIQFTWNSEV